MIDQMLYQALKNLIKHIDPLTTPLAEKEAAQAALRAFEGESLYHSRFVCTPTAGEPFFTLLARDGASDGLVEIWCETRRMQIALGLKPKDDMAKIIQAHRVAEDMRAWREHSKPLALNELMGRASQHQGTPAAEAKGQKK